MRTLDDPNNKILDSFTNPQTASKVFGQVKGFFVTTFVSSSKDVTIDKDDVLKAWELIKSDEVYRNFFDNHQTHKDTVGYIKQAHLVEEGDFLGIYSETDVTNEEVWRKFESGEYTGFSAGFGNRVPQESVAKDYTKAVEIVIEKNSYNSEEINQFKSLFPDSDRVVVNQTYRFAAVPIEIIYLNFYFNLQFLVQLAENHPVASTLLTVSGLILKSAIEVMVKDAYSFVKNGAKKLFSKKRKPKVVVKSKVMSKEIQIRLEDGSPEKMKKSVESLKQVYNQLIGQNKTKMKEAQKIIFDQVDGKWHITLDFEKEKYKRLH